MRAAVDEEGREAVAESRGSVVDGKLGKHEMQIPVVLAAVGVGAQRVAYDTVSPLHLGIGVFVVGRAIFLPFALRMFQAISTIGDTPALVDIPLVRRCNSRSWCQ